MNMTAKILNKIITSQIQEYVIKRKYSQLVFPRGMQVWVKTGKHIHFNHLN